MKILIVENELYLAQSISAKFSEFGYTCQIAANTKEATRNEVYDAVLLSTNISGQNFYPVIEKHKHSIIIMMVTYINNDTISNPIKAGASDYIQKPFMIEELVRKLEHLKNHNELICKNKILTSYINHRFSNIPSEILVIDKKILAPILIRSFRQTAIDAAVFEYAKNFDDLFQFVSLDDDNAFEQIAKQPMKKLLYLVDFQNMKSNDKEKLFTIIESRRAIVSSIDINEYFPYTSINIDSNNSLFDSNDILTIDNYIKNVLLHFQNKLTDCELGRKLGLSRKSIWEKRRKYGLKKK